jgi:tetratricopeptide (TPR) repeat protein
MAHTLSPEPRPTGARADASRQKGWRRIALAVVIAVLPVACASDKAPDSLTLENVSPSQSPVGNYLAGRHAQSARDIPSAVEFLEATLATDPENRSLLRRTFMLTAMEGNLGEALPLAQRITEQVPEAQVANLVQIVADIRDGELKVAQKRLDALPPDAGMNTFMVPLLGAWIAVGLGDTDAALAALKPLSANKGFKAMYDLHVALVNEVAGNTELAIAAFKRTIEPPGNLSLRLVELLGSLYERTGQAPDAKALYRRYMTEHPTSPLMGPALARLEEGGAPVRSVTTAADGAAEAMFGVSNSVRQRATQDSALVFGRMALALKPDFPRAQILVADMLEADNRLELANDLYSAIDRGSPFSWPARLSIAANLNRLDRTDEAVTQLEAMGKENLALADSYINLGDILRGRDRFAEAISAYDRAFDRIEKLERRHWTLLYARGIALERAKKWPRAEADFLRALEFEPEQPYVLNYLGYSWIDQGLHLKRAQEMIEKAVQLRPNDGYIVDSMGWALYRVGDFEGAARELERAIELRPEDPVINDHLGDAYWKVGRRAEARFQWRRSLRLKPEESLRPPIEAKIERGMIEGEAAKKPSE